jgi:AraC-like DNA-binding protein
MKPFATTKKRDGFVGEKLISLPKTMLKREVERNPLLSSIYITHIGYFPKAQFHFRERKKGCEDNILFYCIDGMGWCLSGGKKYEIKANQFIIIPATSSFLRYGADAKNPWTVYWVHFSGDKLKALNVFFSMENFLTPNSIKFDEKKIRLWEEMYNSLEMGYSIDNLCYANMCLYYFLASFIYPEKQMELLQRNEKSVIDRAISYMKNNIAEKLTVDQIASKFSYSSSHFFSLFRQKTGMSPVDYFIHLKIQKACQLLDLTQLRVKEVAAHIGYDNAYYFSRLFAKVMEVPPREYRTMKKG